MSGFGDSESGVGNAGSILCESVLFRRGNGSEDGTCLMRSTSAGSCCAGDLKRPAVGVAKGYGVEISGGEKCPRAGKDAIGGGTKLTDFLPEAGAGGLLEDRPCFAKDSNKPNDSQYLAMASTR